VHAGIGDARRISDPLIEEQDMQAIDPRLQLEPPSSAVRIWMFVLVFALPMAITVASLAAAMGSEEPKRLVADSVMATWLTSVGIVAALTLPLWWLIDRALRRHRIEVGDDGLEIASAFYKRRLALAELKLDEARVVDLEERTELKPAGKSNAVSMPGFHGGWFRLRNRRKAFVAMTAGSRVLWLPTRNDYDLLLQPRHPQALLEHLRKLAHDR
jgi:hypothetical protein